MLKGLTVKVAVREHNRHIVLAGMWLLGFLAHILPPATVAAWGNRLLALYRLESRIGDGPWEPMEHGMSLKLQAN